MTDRFSAHLRQLADPIWRAQLEHPFVRGIADGSLDLDKFRYWVRQDYRFLIDYCRLLAIAAARSPDLDTLARFADLLQSTTRTEMKLHREVAASVGISAVELEAEPASPVTEAYADFLIRTAIAEDFAQLAAALLPCMWGFSWLGQNLAEGDPPSDPRLAAWIDSYASPEFGALADWCRELVDRLGAEASEPGRLRMEAAFIASSKHELAFWEMCWTFKRPTSS